MPSQNSCHLTWDWECDSEFQGKLHAFTQYSPKSISWVDWLGNSVGVGTGVAVLELSREEIDQICHGDKLGDPATLRFRDPATFRAGEVHNYYHQWQDIIGSSPSAQQVQVLKWKSPFLNTFNPSLVVSRGNRTVRIIHLPNFSGIICRISRSRIL